MVIVSAWSWALSTLTQVQGWSYPGFCGRGHPQGQVSITHHCLWRAKSEVNGYTHAQIWVVSRPCSDTLWVFWPAHLCPKFPCWKEMVIPSRSILHLRYLWQCWNLLSARLAFGFCDWILLWQKQQSGGGFLRRCDSRDLPPSVAF